MSGKQDLRGWIQEARQNRDILTLKGVHWRVEIGAVAELAGRREDPPALLFDEIPDYPPGYRVLVNTLSSPRRLAGCAGLPSGLTTLETVRAWKIRYAEKRLLPYCRTEGGPVLENRLAEREVDLLRFPAPLWRSGDGGRYPGTATLCITRDPLQGTVNVSTARVMIHDFKHVFYRVSAGKDSRRHFEQACREGKPLPVALSFGHHPSLVLISGLNIPYGTCEYDVWGGISGEPLQVVATPIHGLPIPSHAELVVEGKVLCDKTALEGPFGEWSGYYSRQARPEPLIRVQGIYHRNDPILLAVATSRPPSELTRFWAVVRSALLWQQLEEAGVGPIEGVWLHPAGGTRLFAVLSLCQKHPGHARQALMAAASLPAGAYMGKYLVAVDEDIDPTCLEDVLWAVTTRSEPALDLDLIRGAWGGPLDPLADSSSSGLNSRLLIDACRPWGKPFPAVAGFSREERERARKILEAAGLK